jgi:hypothetical protein
MNRSRQTDGAQARVTAKGSLTMTPPPLRPGTRRLHGAALLVLGLALAAQPALAQSEAIATAPTSATTAMPVSAGSPPPSESMVINLIRLLVKQGVITQDAADALRQQAEDEANQARAAAGAASLTAVTPAPDGVIRVPYVPQAVRNQIKEDIKRDVVAQAQAEGWASPGAFPDWISRIQWFGDIRFRDQFNFYSSNNIAPYIDYATFNANGPIDINANTNPNGLPFLNTRQDRINQLSLRARIGMNIKVFDGVSATVRLATGSDNSPVSTTQLLGGGLTKKNIWLDQAYLTLTPTYWSAISLGRVPNQFVHTDLVFDDNLNFDGVTATATNQIGSQGLKVFAAAGAYPLDYVASNFPTSGATKAKDSTKWLYAAQIGAQFQPDALSWSARGAVSFYDYQNVQGQLSGPCDTYNNIKQCSTDSSRPSFMQKGNTLFLIRDITPNPSSPLNYAQPQFVGLSYNYRLIDLTAEVEIPLFGPTRGQLQGDFVRNLSYDPGQALANGSTQPITNFDISPDGASNTYRSGPNGWLVKATVGFLKPSAKGEWNLAAGYKYIEPDAVLDAFNDRDFHLGGTNAKGYFMSANYYFANNTWLSGRWFSATEVFGPPLAIDVLQLELNTKF